MSLMINGQPIEDYGEVISSSSTTHKNEFFASDKVNVSGVSNVATAPSGYYWTNDINSSGKILFGGDVTTMSRKGCRPQWRHKFTITTSGTYFLDLTDTYLYYGLSGESASISRKIASTYKDSNGVKRGCCFLVLQGGGGSGANSNGAIGGYSGGGGGAGAFAVICVNMTKRLEFYVGGTKNASRVGKTTECNCQALGGNDASKNSGGGGCSVGHYNNQYSKEWGLIAEKDGRAGAGSDSSCGSIGNKTVTYTPDSSITFKSGEDGHAGSGGGGAGAPAYDGKGGDGGGGNGNKGGVGAGGGGASWVLFGTNYGGSGGNGSVKIYY